MSTTALVGEIEVSVGTGFFAYADGPQLRAQSVPASKLLRRYCDERCLVMETWWELVRRGKILRPEAGQVNGRSWISDALDWWLAKNRDFTNYAPAGVLSEVAWLRQPPTPTCPKSAKFRLHRSSRQTDGGDVYCGSPMRRTRSLNRGSERNGSIIGLTKM